MSAPIDIRDNTLASSLVPVQCASLAAPVQVRRGRRFTFVQGFHAHTHTHTNRPSGRREGQLREGNAKEEGRSSHQHQRIARSGQILKGQEKRKPEAEGNGTRPEEEGRPEAPQPTCRRETNAYLSTIYLGKGGA